MAIKKCRECGKNVSTGAKACPGCGAKKPTKPKSRALGLLAVFIGVLVLAWMSGAPESASTSPSSRESASKPKPAPTDQRPESSYSERQGEVVALFQSDAEPTAKDAVWTAPEVFKVGVLDNGSSRDGYALYVCNVLYEHGFKGREIWVQVIDIVKLVSNDKWERVGQARCQ